MSELLINFGLKITQTEFAVFLKRDETAKLNLVEKSFTDSVKKIKFNFQLCEWISTDQVTVVLAWIWRLKRQGKQVSIILPYRYDIVETGYESKIKLDLSKLKFKESNKRIKRRKE